MKYLLFLILLIIGATLNAQNTFSKKIDLDSNALRNYVNDLKTIDNNVILTSSSLCALGTSDVACLNLSKFSIKGNLEKSIVLDSFNSFTSGKEGLEVKGEEIIISTHQKDDYFKFTSVLNYDHNLNNKKFVKYDQSPSSSKIGNQGVTLVNNYFYTHGIISNSYALPDSIQIIKIDDAGNEIWRKYYTNDNASLKVNGLQGTPDGNLAFIMELSGPPGNNDYFDGYHIMKIDTSGAVLDSFVVEEPDKKPNRLLVASDGSFYFGMNSHPVNDIPFYGSSGTINKLNDDMNSLEWSFDMPNNQLVDGRYFEFYDFLEAKNGDIIVCGTVFDNTDTELATGVPGRNSTWNGFIIRLTPDGEMKWLRLYKHNNDLLPHDEYGKFRPSKLDKIKELPDGRLVGAGNVYVNNRQYSGINEAETEGFHLWLLMVDEHGCLEGEECEEIIRLSSSQDSVVSFENHEWIYEEVEYFGGGNAEIGFANITIPAYIYQDGTVLYGDTVSPTLYIENDKMYFWDEYYEDYIMYYDWQETESYEIPYYDQFMDSEEIATVVIDSISHLIFGNDSLQVQHVHILNSGIFEGYVEDIYSGIGAGNNGIKLILDCGLCDDNPYTTKLRCFANDTITYQFVPYACDSTWLYSSTHEIDKEQLKLYPNPTSEMVYIDGINTDVEYQLFSLSGQLIKQGITTNKTVNIEDNGFYIVKLKVDGNWILKKIVKME